MGQMPFPCMDFPEATEANKNGLVAIGGDLSAGRLLTAYSKGIFPWYEDPYPVLWWSPDPRMVLYPENIKVSDSLRRRIRNGSCEIRIDTVFEQVIRRCATVSDRSTEGSWITPAMTDAYINLHEKGYAHSFETWNNGVLAGGLYGVSLGKAFFGESMFFLQPDASKIALIYLCRLMQHLGFHFIDVQQETTHLKSMGAIAIPRKNFLEILKNALQFETIQRKWTTFGCQNKFLNNPTL